MSLLLKFLIVFKLSTLASSEGVFEFSLLAFHNENGHTEKGLCCHGDADLDPLGGHKTAPCTRACSTFFRICLKQYQTNIDPDPPCTYGSRVTSVIEANRINFASQKDFQEPMRFPFSFAWPGQFSLIVEAWHNTTKNGKELLTRLAAQRTLQVGTAWKGETHTSPSSKLELQYRILCAEHYYGPQCMEYCRPRDDAYGHYTCGENGERTCLDGWQGHYCDKAICKPGCHPEHGFCEKPNECNCSLGFIGDLCDQCQRYPQCQHGSCERPWDCICESGWGGLFCNQDLNYCTHHKPCKNGGVCTNTGAGHYSCECVLGFTGTNCEIKIEDCTLEPCMNGGKCQETGTNYTCTCMDGYSGRHCQTFATTCQDRPCENAGTCVDTADGYMCLCGPGWEGENCDTEKDECQPNPCMNGGRCIEDFNGFQCVCPIGFEGDRCQENKNDCGPETCLNGGTCIDQINSFKCECAPGFIGSLCQHNIDDCVQRPCANGGTCFDLINDYRCMCRPGFKGKDCSIDINECDSSPCRNGATCQDGVDDYTCHCEACFTGKNCEERNDDCIFESTFRPLIVPYQVTTPPPGPENAFGPYHHRPNAPLGPQRTAPPSMDSQTGQGGQQAVLNILIPILVLFLILVLVLLAIIYWLIRRHIRQADRKNPPGLNPEGSTGISKIPDEILDNELNKVIQQQTRKVTPPGLNLAYPPGQALKINNQTYARIIKGAEAAKLESPLPTAKKFSDIPCDEGKLGSVDPTINQSNRFAAPAMPPPSGFKCQLSNINIYDETVPDSPGFERKAPFGDYPKKASNRRRRPQSSFAPRTPNGSTGQPQLHKLPRSQTPPTPSCCSSSTLECSTETSSCYSASTPSSGGERKTSTDLSITLSSTHSKDSGLSSPSDLVHNNREPPSPQRGRKSKPPPITIVDSAFNAGIPTTPSRRSNLLNTSQLRQPPTKL